MANQRMYVRCSCGEEFSIAKRMAIGYYAHPWATKDPAAFVRRLNEFLDSHEYCEDYPDCFGLSYELGAERYMPRERVNILDGAGGFDTTWTPKDEIRTTKKALILKMAIVWISALMAGFVLGVSW